MGGSEKESLKGWITKRLKGGLWTEATWKHQGPPLGQENVDYPCVGIAIYLEDPIAAKAQKSCSIVLLKELTEFFSVSQSVQSLSHVQLFVTPYTAVHQASLSITNKFGACSNSCPLGQWCRPTISSSVIPFFCLQSFPASGSFSNESVLHTKWPKYRSFSFSISPSNEYSGLISFRMGWLDLLAVQGTLKSLLQQHSSKASILQCSAFFMASIHDYWKSHSFG